MTDFKLEILRGFFCYQSQEIYYLLLPVIVVNVSIPVVVVSKLYFDNSVFSKSVCVNFFSFKNAQRSSLFV